MSSSVLSFLGVGSAIKALIEFLRFWREQEESVHLDLSMKRMQVRMKRAEVESQNLANVRKLLEIAKEYGTCDLRDNASEERIAHALETLLHYCGDGTIEDLRLTQGAHQPGIGIPSLLESTQRDAEVSE